MGGGGQGGWGSPPPSTPQRHRQNGNFLHKLPHSFQMKKFTVQIETWTMRSSAGEKCWTRENYDKNSRTEQTDSHLPEQVKSMFPLRSEVTLNTADTAQVHYGTCRTQLRLKLI